MDIRVFHQVGRSKGVVVAVKHGRRYLVYREHEGGLAGPVGPFTLDEVRIQVRMIDSLESQPRIYRED